MSGKNKKQVGVWMDSQRATIVGKERDQTDFVLLAHVNNPGPDKNPNENAANHQEIALTHKFFKEIAASMVNTDEVHITGTGQIQEQFIHFLAETPQYKNIVSTESTSNRMDNKELIEFTKAHFS